VFNIRQYDGKLLIKPMKEKVPAFCQRIGEEIKALNGTTAEAIIRKLNPILKGAVRPLGFRDGLFNSNVKPT
jgi:RNA-directed DNA polymerase